YTLSLHDALPISERRSPRFVVTHSPWKVLGTRKSAVVPSTEASSIGRIRDSNVSSEMCSRRESSVVFHSSCISDQPMKKGRNSPSIPRKSTGIAPAPYWGPSGERRPAGGSTSRRLSLPELRSGDPSRLISGRLRGIEGEFITARDRDEFSSEDRNRSTTPARRRFAK